MTKDKREEIRSDNFNLLLFTLRLLPGRFSTFGAFLDEFEKLMKQSEIGECTEEDLKWAYTTLDSWEAKQQSVI